MATESSAEGKANKGAVVSTPQPQATDPNVAPAGDALFRKGIWAGKEHFTCLFPEQRVAPGGREHYELPCRRTFFSHDELMTHISDDHQG